MTFGRIVNGRPWGGVIRNASVLRIATSPTPRLTCGFRCG